MNIWHPIVVIALLAIAIFSSSHAYASTCAVKLLYGNTVDPYAAPLFGYAPSSDTRSIIFGMNFDFSNSDIDGTGIYKMDFNHPLRDFG